MVEGQVHRGLGHADGEGAHARPEQVQGAHGDLEPGIDLAEHLGALDPDAVELETSDRVRREQLEVFAGQARAVAGNGERGHAAGARILGGPGEDRVDVGLRRVGDPDLLAAQSPAVAVDIGTKAKSRGVGAGVGLGQGEGCDDLAG